MAAPRHFWPQTKSGRKTLPVVNFWTLPAAKCFRTLLAPKFLDKSNPETSPTLRQV